MQAAAAKKKRARRESATGKYGARPGNIFAAPEAVAGRQGRSPRDAARRSTNCRDWRAACKQFPQRRGRCIVVPSPVPAGGAGNLMHERIGDNGMPWARNQQEGSDVESLLSTLSDEEADHTVRKTRRSSGPDRNLDATLGEMTHAVLNALNAIAAAAELSKLILGRREPAEAAKALARIEPECMRAARLLREGRALLTFPGCSTSSEVDVAGLLRCCAETFADRVDVTADQDLPTISGDPAALRRLFMEILGNAFDFGAGRVQVTLEQDGEGYALWIGFHDDGPGVKVPAARVFEPFFSTRPDQHSGLGLALATKIAAAHGGRVGLSETDRGALFWIELPAHAL
jgi:signal transduction histidine kinase